MESSTSPIIEQSRHAQVEFSGKAGEFFGIWIVNILLSILTLGIYSAWAKVRTNQYFYGHTRIEDQPFRYLAKPLQILKGRLIAVALFASYFILSAVAPIAGLLMALGLMFLMPFLIVLSMRFSMRMTSYRNVRFDFHGSYADAFINFLLLPILSIFTLYLLMPWVLKRIDQYLHSNISYGGKRLQVNNDAGTYYAAVLIIIAVVTGVIMTAVILGFVIAFLSPFSFGAEWAMVLVFGIILLYWLILMLSGAIYKCMIRNHLFSRTTLPDTASFASKMEVMPYLWLTVSNLLAILCTFGLAYPWARVRKTAYLANATSLTLQPGIDQLVDTVQQQTAAFGEEAAGLFDVDISLA